MKSLCFAFYLCLMYSFCLGENFHIEKQLSPILRIVNRDGKRIWEKLIQNKSGQYVWVKTNT